MIMSMISVEMFIVKIWLSMKAPLKVLEFPVLHRCIRYNELFLQMVIFSCFGDDVVEPHWQRLVCWTLAGVKLCYAGGFGYHANGLAGWSRRTRVVVATPRKDHKGSWQDVSSIVNWKRLNEKEFFLIDHEAIWSKASQTNWKTASKTPYAEWLEIEV